MMQNIAAILSMLHEPPGRNSAVRGFREQPILAWTLERLSRARHLSNMAILCWQDQLEAVTPIAGEHGACILSKDPRVSVPNLESITASRRWADGWRGGLGGACDFDLGFHAGWTLEAAARMGNDAVVLVDPAAGLVDPDLIDRIIEHAQAHESVQICFTQAAPGLAGALLKPSLLQQLAGAGTHPGRILSYIPDQPVRDPIAGEGCVPVPASIARTTHSFKLDSDRQVARLTEAAISLNGELMESSAEGLLKRLEWSSQVDPLPREVVLELTPRRASRPIHLPGRYHPLDRPDLHAGIAQRVIAELAQADDARLTLAGAGDPLLHPQLIEIVQAAQHSGLSAIHVETDLLVDHERLLDELVDSAVDVISVHMPALTPTCYEKIMGVDGLQRAINNIQILVQHRHNRRRGVPLLVPTFVKCRENMAEMESWYDQWLRALGNAVIAGPAEFGGMVPACGVADMSPPRRRACGRLRSRLMILSDGRAVSCEQDIAGHQVVGDLNTQSLADVWNAGMAPLREAHSTGCFDSPVCRACAEWHRP